MNTKELLKLITELPDVDDFIYVEEDGKQIVTTEWICGAFAGRAFEGDNIEDCLNQMITYFEENKDVDCMVGRILKDSGWPDIKQVKDYVS